MRSTINPVNAWRVDFDKPAPALVVARNPIFDYYPVTLETGDRK
jgi:hypothetical protein